MSEKVKNALWRDTLENKTWMIAKEILEEKQDIFLESLERFREEVAKEFRLRVLNEVGPSLTDLWVSRGMSVIQNAIHALYAILDIQVDNDVT